MLAPDDEAGASWATGASTASASLYMPAAGGRAVSPRHLVALERLRQFYAEIRSVHLDAGAWIWNPTRSGEGTYEYWADGEKYRLRSTADPRLGLAQNVEAAWDLDKFQTHYLEESRLHLREQNLGKVPAAFENPFFLPVSFLTADDDTCPTCETTLKLVMDETRWAARVGLARSVPAGRSRVNLTLPGGQLAGKPYYHRVLVDTRRNEVLRMELVRPDGRVFGAIDFSRFAPVAGSAIPFPHHIVLTSFDEQGQRSGGVHFMVKTLELNRPIEPERFTLAAADARIVIDEDARTFLKHPRLKQE